MDRDDALKVVAAYDDATVRDPRDDLELARLIRALVHDGKDAPDIAKPLAARVSFLRETGTTGIDDEIVMRALELQGYFHGRDYEEIGALQFAWLLEQDRHWGYSGEVSEVLERLQQGRISAAEQVELALRLVDGADGDLSSLDDVVAVIDLLERLDCPEKGERLRAAAHEVLVEEDLDWLSEQCDAVRVMERFGVPVGFDLAAQHDELKRAAHGAPFGTPDIDPVLAYVSLAAIERFPEWEPVAELRSALSYRLWHYRDALIALLVAVASVVITLRTPKASAPAS